MSAQTTLFHQQLYSLKLPLIKDQYNELSQTPPNNPRATSNTSAASLTPSINNCSSHHPAPHQVRALSRLENLGTVPMTLTQENQPSASPKPLPPRVPVSESERYFLIERVPPLVSPCGRAALRRLFAVSQRSLYQRHLSINHLSASQKKSALKTELKDISPLKY